MPTFRTESEMINAGFVPAKAFSHSYRGIGLYARDTSGGRSFGYAFTIFAALSHRIDQCCTSLFDIEFGHATFVWLTDELNQLRRPGCFVMAFSPTTIAAAVSRAELEIDSYRMVVTEEMVFAADEQDRIAREASAQEDRERRAKINSAIIASAPAELDSLPAIDRPMRGNRPVRARPRRATSARATGG